MKVKHLIKSEADSVTKWELRRNGIRDNIELVCSNNTRSGVVIATITEDGSIQLHELGEPGAKELGLRIVTKVLRQIAIIDANPLH